MYYAPRRPFYQSDTFPTVFGAFPLLRTILIRERITLVHAHQAFSTMANEAILHARTMGFKVVFTDHSLFGFADTSSILINKVLKFTLADAHQIICVSHTSKENTVLRACVPPDRVSVIPNGVDASFFSTANADDALNNPPHHKQQHQQDYITIVALSRLVYRKGIDLLAVILPELCTRHPHINFIIGGDGPKRHVLDKVVTSQGLTDRVTLVGPVPHDKVKELLSQGQIFLNCSLTEAFCMALVEAAAAGLLVVSTKVGGVPEVLPPEMLILADPSPEGLIEAVDVALDRIGYRGPAEHWGALRHMYNWSQVTTRTLAVYHNALNCDRDDSMVARLHRFYLCGKWFGKICCCIAAVDWLYWKYLEWRHPAVGIRPAADLKIHKD